MSTNEEKRLKMMLTIENALYLGGYGAVAGVDEAGRGPLAGDVFAAAVILPKGLYIEGLDDSKKLTPKKREELYDVIINTALSYSVASASVLEIDTYNIRNATHLAMKRAVEGLKLIPDYIIVDGNSSFESEIPLSCVVGGDQKSLSIAAASVLAKVERDRYITELGRKYPEYNFAKHKGYGTVEHIKIIREIGPCPIHRKTFLKKIISA